MFDRAMLPPARFEFVVIADTHYMIDPTGKQVEFNSRRRQTARTEYALRQVAALMAHEDDPLIIHMGDSMQEFPEQPDFAQARAEALAQMARIGVSPHFVAGNHDVGDKPDPTMPASWVTPEFLADYHANFGRSWYSWDQAGLHFVVLNSQIMNSALPAATEQAAWLEADLAAHDGARIMLFLHLPPFLCTADEPDLGHYDNLGEPARSWLLQLIAQHRVELVFAAHVHWAYYNQIGVTRYYTTPSVAFTRPGFSELFSSPPPAEQGRDDVEKLGFFLVRVHEEGSSVHFIRTAGRTLADMPATLPAQLISGTPTDLRQDGPLGVVARHPIAPTGEVPSAWPSTIRQPVRNDYGLLTLLELGVRQLRVPAADLADPIQRERLSILRSHGVTITGQWLYDPRRDLANAIHLYRDQIDAVEVTLLGALWPDAPAIQQLRAVHESALPITLSSVVPGHKVPGKQHNRSQIGYLTEQLGELNQRLAAHDLTFERVTVRLTGTIAEIVATMQNVPQLTQIAAIDWLYTLPTGNELIRNNSVAAALFAILQRPADKLLLEPLVDLDRTMDAGPGLLDRIYNPRTTFHLVRHLNTLLFPRGGEKKNHRPATAMTFTTDETHHHFHGQSDRRSFDLILPIDPPSTLPPHAAFALSKGATQVVTLISGQIRTAVEHDGSPITEPTLFCGTI